MNILRLTMRTLRYELRTRQWYINAFAVMLATALITLFYVYSERLNLVIKAESSHILGGDLVLTSPYPFSSEAENEAKKIGLNVATVWSTQTVAKAKNQFQLVNLQAVFGQYPLVTSKPLSILDNTILVEPRLLPLLHLNINDSLQIGDSSFKIGGLLTPDTDSLSTGFNIAPRAMIKLQDLAKTNILLPGSRVDYRLLFTGSTKQLQTYRTWLKTHIKSGQRVLDIHAQEYTLSNTLSNIFLAFQAIILLTFLLCVITILVNAKEYVNQHIPFAALWRTLGASKAHVTLIFSLQILMMAIISTLVGVVIAIVMEYPIDYVITTFTAHTLPPTGKLTLFYGALAGFVLLLLTSWMQILSLASVSPKHLFQREIKLSPYIFRYAVLLNAIAIIAYLYLFIGFNLFTLFFLSTVILSIGILLIATDRIIMALRYLTHYTNGSLRRGIYFLVQQANTTIVQLSAFTLICTFSSCVLLIQKSLLLDFAATWNKEKPNYFIYNIPASEVPSLQNFLSENYIKREAFYPILRGRLVAINNTPLQERTIDWHHNALRREINLTSSGIYPSDNVIIAGKQTARMYPIGVSIEKTLAKALSVKLNDTLTFQMADKTLTGQIDNIRTVKWQSLHPNFYVIFNQNTFDNFITPYLSSIYVPENKRDILNTLLEKYTSVTLIDVSNVINQIQKLIDYAALVISYLLIASVIAAVLVTFSCLLTSSTERHQTKKLLITLGASRSYIQKSVFFQTSIMLLMIISISTLLTYLIYTFGIVSLFFK